MALPKPQPGAWTYDDLFALPADKRHEIIEGELYEMPPPTWAHATTIMNLIALLLPVVSAIGGQLRTAPVGVFFPGADPVEPDLLVILPGSRAIGGGRGVEGPPDLVIEVLSPSNRDHDLLTKRALYGRAGVREYWIVDPEARTVEVLTLDRDALHSLRTAAAHETITSPVLGDAAFPVAAVFARLDEIEG
jgi:Uma2 family endonuclease